MEILITGGTGFIGRAMCTRLAAAGHTLTVLSRRPAQVPELCGAGVRGVASLHELGADYAPDAAINLAGAPIADRRWTAARKQELLSSRIDTTRDLARFLATRERRPAVLVSASAVGYYGATGNRELDEGSPPVKEFQHDLCRRWEEAALAAAGAVERVCIMRLGIVLGEGGGALQKMITPFRLGLGGPIGTGRQWMSWVHREDVLCIIDFLLEKTNLAGAFNATAPTPVMNRQFARELGRAVHRPAVIPVPAAVLRVGLGELAHLLLTGQHVRPRRLLEAGYRFTFPQLPEALAEAVGD